MRSESPSPSLAVWLKQAPTALTLSSGFFGFYAHTGLILELEAVGFQPARLTGSSAGALVAGAWAAGTDLKDLRQILLSLQRKDFWDPGPGLGLLKGRRFLKLLNDLLPVKRFEDCRWPLAVSVYDALSRSTRVIDSGPLAPAIHASCAVPLLFQPVWQRGRPLFDGGVADRHGMAGMHGNDRILYHHLASRSPWRRSDSPALKLPQRPGTVSLVLHGLPRSGPFKLPRGAEALVRARFAARRALEETIVDRRVEVSA